MKTFICICITAGMAGLTSQASAGAPAASESVPARAKWASQNAALQAPLQPVSVPVTAEPPQPAPVTSVPAPASPSRATQPAARPQRRHIVAAGESMASIARKHGVRLDHLISANPNLDPTRLNVGQTLIIPSPVERVAPVEVRPGAAADMKLTDTLREAIFAEDQLDLSRAVELYGEAIADFERQHGNAALAVFRLGEIHRRQGQTAEARAHYERVLREFSQHTELARLSREALRSAEPDSPSQAVTDSAEPDAANYDRGLEAAASDRYGRLENGFYELAKAKTELERLRQRFTSEHPLVLKQVARVEQLENEGVKRVQEARTAAFRSAAVEALTSEVRKAEARLQELRTRYADDHPDVHRQVLLIQAVKLRIQHELGELNAQLSGIQDTPPADETWDFVVDPYGGGQPRSERMSERQRAELERTQRALGRRKDELARLKIRMTEAESEYHMARTLLDSVASARQPQFLPRAAAQDPRYQELKKSYEEMVLKSHEEPAEHLLERLKKWVEQIYVPELEADVEFKVRDYDRLSNEAFHVENIIDRLEKAVSFWSSPEAVRRAVERLQIIEGAKQQWALEHQKEERDTPTGDDIAAYIRGGFPPSEFGERYDIRALDRDPVLAIEGVSNIPLSVLRRYVED